MTDLLRKWLPLRPVESGALPLFCLPHAGSGASVYRDWDRRLAHAGVAPYPVQPPGREGRIQEEAYREVRPLAVELVEVLRPLLAKPYALFGHSMGALVAFELARELRRANCRPPVHIFVSGRGAPQLPPAKTALHRLSDEDLERALRALGGVPTQLDEYPEMLRMHLPLMRADLELNEDYDYVEEGPLGTPITAFGGQQDQVVPEFALRAWQQQTSGRFAARMLPGGHFFIQESLAPVLRSLASDVSISLADDAVGTAPRGGRRAVRMRER